MLKDAVQAVLAAESRPAEIVVIDQSSVRNEGVAALRPRSTSVRYLQSDTVGLSVSRNLAVATAAQPVIAFVDDDVLVTPTWLSEIVAALRSAGEACVVTGRVVAGRPEDAAAFMPSQTLADERQVYHGPIRRDVLRTYNMALYRSTFSAVGGLDERLGPGTKYPAAEDNEFAHRLLRAGYSIAYEPAAVVVHRSWRPRRSRRSLRFDYGKGQGAFFATHVSSPYMARRASGTLIRRLIDLPAQFRADARFAGEEAAWLCGFAAGYVERLADGIRDGLAPERVRRRRPPPASES